MNYKINWGLTSGAFAVPDCVVDDFLKLASPKYAKVILYIFRYQNECTYNAEKIAAAVGINTEDAEDALSYWEQVGIISREGLASNVNENKLIPENNAGQVSDKLSSSSVTQPIKAEITVHRSRERVVKMLTPSEIAERIEGSGEIDFLFKSAEDMLAKVLTHTEHRTLIWIYDYYGLKADIIIMIIEYCKSISKANIAYIEKVASTWYEKDITSHEKAEAEILRLQGNHTLELKVKSKLELNRSLISKEKEFIANWSSLSISIDLIMLAYEKAVNAIGKLSFNYMNKLLIDWYEKGLNTVESVERANASYSAAKNKKGIKNYKNDVDKEHSYDLNKILEFSMNNIPEFKES